MKKEIPILFSTPMVQATLAGKKTMTRRIINPQPIIDHDSGRVFDGKHCRSPFDMHNWKEPFIDYFSRWMPEDLLWVRESFEIFSYDENNTSLTGKFISDDQCFNKITIASDEWEKYCHWKKEFGKKPSLFLFRSLSRIWLEVTNIKIERLRDISEADCIAEGILYYDDQILGRRYKDYLSDASGHGHSNHDYPTVATAKESFKSVWQLINGIPKPIQQKINGKLVTVGYEIYPFDEDAGKEWLGKTSHRGLPLTVTINPWVWVISFKVLSTTGKPVYLETVENVH